jgi:hypothetical protein
MSAISLDQALDRYAELLSHPTLRPEDLKIIAQKTIELDKLAHSVMGAASSTLRSTAADLEHLLQSPLYKDVSILNASKHYLENPSTEELPALVQDLQHNELALGLMRKELTLLSGSLKNPGAAAS